MVSRSVTYVRHIILDYGSALGFFLVPAMLRMLLSQYHPTCLIPFLSQVINALSRPASDLRIPAFDVDVLARAVIRPLLAPKFEQNMLSVWTALSSHKRIRAPLFVSILLIDVSSD